MHLSPVLTPLVLIIVRKLFPSACTTVQINKLNVSFGPLKMPATFVGRVYNNTGILEEEVVWLRLWKLVFCFVCFRSFFCSFSFQLCFFFAKVVLLLYFDFIIRFFCLKGKFWAFGGLDVMERDPKGLSVLLGTLLGLFSCDFFGDQFFEGTREFRS